MQTPFRVFFNSFDGMFYLAMNEEAYTTVLRAGLLSGFCEQRPTTEGLLTAIKTGYGEGQSIAQHVFCDKFILIMTIEPLLVLKEGLERMKGNRGVDYLLDRIQVTQEYLRDRQSNEDYEEDIPQYGRTRRQ